MKLGRRCCGLFVVFCFVFPTAASLYCEIRIKLFRELLIDRYKLADFTKCQENFVDSVWETANHLSVVSAVTFVHRNDA